MANVFRRRRRGEVDVELGAREYEAGLDVADRQQACQGPAKHRCAAGASHARDTHDDMLGAAAALLHIEGVRGGKTSS